MTRVGIIGLGFMGMIHYLAYQKIPGVKVVALCDSKSKRLAGDWKDIKGNFGPPGQQMNLEGITTYENPDDLISDENIDLIDITLPPSLHKDIAIKSLRARKHVFCEKPMALSLEDCEIMLDAKGDDQHLLIGHVLPFFPEYAWALREIRSGEHGKLIDGSFKRLISDPSWLTNFWSPTLTGGPMLDLHVHDAHFIRMLFGMPTDVSTCGTLRNELPERWHTVFNFNNPDQFAHVTSGVISQQGRSFVHGFEIHLERATLMFEYSVNKLHDGQEQAGYCCPPTLLDPSGITKVVDVGDGDPMNAFSAELLHATKTIRAESRPDALACELARDAIQICQMESQNLINSPSNLSIAKT